MQLLKRKLATAKHLYDSQGLKGISSGLKQKKSAFARRLRSTDGGNSGPVAGLRPSFEWNLASPIIHVTSAACARPSVGARKSQPDALASGTRRRSLGAGRDLGSHQKGADAQRQTILFLDEAGFHPLPSVVRTYAPIGHTPILREWGTRDHLSAISTLSLEGKRSFRCQDRALNAVDVVALLEHLL